MVNAQKLVTALKCYRQPRTSESKCSSCPYNINVDIMSSMLPTSVYITETKRTNTLGFCDIEKMLQDATEIIEQLTEDDVK